MNVNYIFFVDVVVISVACKIKIISATLIQAHFLASVVLFVLV
jgi:hypothetical protein